MSWDVFKNVSSLTIKCLDKGHVILVDCMPRLVSEDRKTSDEAVVQAARVSYGRGLKSVKEDIGLIRYMMRNAHWTPFEMVEFKFDIKLPIFLARQWIRHRTASVNEISGRYSILNDEFFVPDEINYQSTENKQGSGLKVTQQDLESIISNIESTCKTSYQEYQQRLEKGVSKEQARITLPLNLYTRWYWKIDLRNLLNFLNLRTDSHAQKEIREYAQAILTLIEPIIPECIKAWRDYSPYQNAVLLTALEVEACKNGTLQIKSENKREQEEWNQKAKKLGFTS